MNGNLPRSTERVVRALLEETVDVSSTVSWARDLWERGCEQDEIVSLALLQEHEWSEAASLLPKALGAVGLETPGSQMAVLEKGLLTDYIDGKIDEVGLERAGFSLWRAATYSDTYASGHPFDIYNELGDSSYELPSYDWAEVPQSILRPWVLEKLTADGAFSRTGLAPPAA